MQPIVYNVVFRHFGSATPHMTHHKVQDSVQLSGAT